jgi:hypothetical protein
MDILLNTCIFDFADLSSIKPAVHVVMLAGSVGEFNSLLNDMVRPRVCHLMEAASLQAIGIYFMRWSI